MEEFQHKYEIVYNFIKNGILSGDFKYSDKLMSENELSARFSLSRSTVRHAIELLTNEGFLEKRHGSGTYVKAASPNISRTGLIGVITTYLDDYIFPGIIKGIENVATMHNYSINLGITENKIEKENACLRSMLNRNIDGLIIEGTKSAIKNPNIRLLETFKKRQIPVLFINGNYSDFDSSYVLMDDEKSGKMVVDFLFKNGHRKIGGILKSDDIQGHRRYDGMAKALRANRISFDENSVLWYTTEDLEHIFSTDYDHLFMRRFKNSTAILCYNDQIAVKAMQTLERNGVRVPQDISIVGFDNSFLCEIYPVKITSVTHAGYDMGETAAKTLLKILAAQNPANCRINKILSSTLIVRDSVRNLRKR